MPLKKVEEISKNKKCNEKNRDVIKFPCYPQLVLDEPH